MESFENYVLLFFACAVLGWVMEVVCKLVQFGRFINRGFLLGPYCPIYGFGAVLVTAVLNRHADTPLSVFLLAMALCGALEYVTSYVMEKVFHARWWDYGSRRFNLNGRVCANTLIPFGLLGLSLVYWIQPFFFGLFDRLPANVKTGLCVGLICLMAADAAVSAKVLHKVTRTAALSQGDDTETVTRLVREELFRKGWLHRRLLRAYPDVRLYNARILQKIREDRDRVRAELRDARQRLRDDLAEYENRLKNKK